MALTTNEPPEGEVWKLDISAKMAVLGTQLIEVFPVDSVQAASAHALYVHEASLP
jgi:hypothetical protein